MRLQLIVAFQFRTQPLQIIIVPACTKSSPWTISPKLFSMTHPTNEVNQGATWALHKAEQSWRCRAGMVPNPGPSMLRVIPPWYAYTS